MRLASAIVDGHEEWVLMTAEGSIRGSRLAAAAGVQTGPQPMEWVLAGGPGRWETIAGWAHRAHQEGLQDPVRPTFLAPLPRPRNIICVGLNYRPHVAESSMEIPRSPVLFNKYSFAVVGDGAVVRPPQDSSQLDYEAELVVVMGRSASRVEQSRALDYVFGYCNGNDLSDRALQFRTGQWLLGKAGDGFGPIGPFITTRDEIADPGQLDIRCLRNGVEVQHANTREMIFPIPFLIDYISRYITLQPGDLIFTGTPEGVILGYPEDKRRWLSQGEEIVVAIEGLGRLVTTIGPRWPA